MGRPVYIAVALVSLALVESAAFPQSLAELAAKEKERRKAATKPAKTYTDEDLKKGTGTTTPGSEASTPEATPAPAETAASAEEGGASRDQAQAAWRQRIQTAREDHARIKSQVDELQTRVDAEKMWGLPSERLVKDLEDGKSKLAEVQASIDSLEQEGRLNAYRE